MRLVYGKTFQFFRSIRQFRRIGFFIVKEWTQLIASVRNHIRSFNDDLKRLFLSQITEFLQHFLRCFEIERRLVYRIFEAFRGHDDRSEYGILRIEKMHVSRGCNRFPQFFADFDYMPVVIAECFNVFSNAFPYHKCVVSDGLDFKVIIPRSYFQQFFLGFPRDHSPEKLTRFACASQNYALTVYVQKALRYFRLFIEMVKVGIRDQLIQVFKPGLRFCKQNYMIAFQLFSFLDRAVYQRQHIYIALFLLREQFAEKLFYFIGIFFCRHIREFGTRLFLFPS